MKRKYLILAIAFIIIGIFITIFSTSYAYLKREVDTGKKVELITGTLNYTIEGTNINNNKITISAYSHNEINISVKSLNRIQSKYELYYKIITALDENEINKISIGYPLEQNNYLMGVINPNEVKTSTIKILNSTSKDIEIEFGVDGGFIYNELVLLDNHYPIKKATQLIEGQAFASAISELAGGKNNIRKLLIIDDIKESSETRKLSVDGSKEDIYAYYDNSNQIVYIYSKGYIYLNPNSRGLLDSFQELEDMSAVGVFDASKVKNLTVAFQILPRMKDWNPIRNFDTSNVMEMAQTFGWSHFPDMSIVANWDVSNCSEFWAIFAGNASLTNLNGLENWKFLASDVKIGSMFSDCVNLTDISALANWDISNVTVLYDIFSGDRALSDITPLSNWDTSKNTLLATVFENCTSLIDISALSNWNTSNVIDMNNSFYGCTNIKSLQPIFNWDTPKVVYMNNMFDGIKSDIQRPDWYHE